VEGFVHPIRNKWLQGFWLQLQLQQEMLLDHLLLQILRLVMREVKKNGWWSVGYVFGTPGGPFFMGFVQQHVGTEWIYFIFAIVNFVEFVCYLFSRETVYNTIQQESALRNNNVIK
jgi:hypothetical protein